MAEEALVLRGINWREAFPFTNIFRAFRVAVHPSKLFLALVAMLAIYLGGRVLDGVWPNTSRAIILADRIPTTQGSANPAAVLTNEREFGISGVPASEVEAYADVDPTADLSFGGMCAQMRQEVERRYANLLVAEKVETDPANAAKTAVNHGKLDALEDQIVKDLDARRDAIDKSYLADESAAASAPADQQATLYKNARQLRAHDRLVAFTLASQELAAARTIDGQGIFDQLLKFELGQFASVIGGATNLNPRMVANALSRMIVKGPAWLIRCHYVYAVLFGVWGLIIWAIFGGAIARIAAVHIARDEKLSVRAALRFSAGKFLSFIFAPIIPLALVLFVGLLATAGALVGNIPSLGPIIVGALFFLALGAGFIMTLFLVVTAGGFNLMYPTIAVEGSDSFDAISRSCSYVYNRPWRMVFYSVVALVYGSLCYMFVRFFVVMMLRATHYFVNLGMFTHADNGLPLWHVMWPRLGSRLFYHVDTVTLGPGQTLGAYFVALWVYLVISLLGAFVVSFFFSANTIIYYLMRREVDATELDDVYLEQPDDDFTEAGTVATATVTSVSVSSTTAEPAAPVQVTPAGDASTPPAAATEAPVAQPPAAATEVPVPPETPPTQPPA